MKTIFLSLIFYASVFAQSPLLLLMDDSGVQVDADVQTYFDALTTPLSADQQVRIDTFVKMLKDSIGISNLSDKFDVMYLMANETSEAGLKNLVKRLHDAEVGAATVTFTADQGFTGDGASGYINTNYNPTSDKDNFIGGVNEPTVQQSASIGIYSRTNAQSASFVFGAASQYIILQTRSGSDQLIGYYFSGSSASVANNNSSGLIALTTNTDVSKFSAYRNGLSLSDDLNSSNSVPNQDVYICCYNNNGSPAGFNPYQFSFFFIGGELTATEMRGLNNCIEWYMDDLGTGVE